MEVQSPDENLLETGGLDSVTLVQLLLDLEERFNVRLMLSELDLDDFSTVRGLARLVSAQRSGAGGAAIGTRAELAPAAPASAAAQG